MNPERSIRLGPYETLAELASGGMGTVYLAHHAGAAGFERLVVIKRVHKHLLKSREFANMFRDEARLASLIRHPNVVSVDDVQESSGELFLVQPYVESLTLADLIDEAKTKGESIPPNIAVRIVGDALAGLEGAHEAKDLRGQPLEIVHRDVSPDNVLVGTDGRSRLIDFGVAKARRRLTVTDSGVLKGKLAYMAPEQFKHQEVDRRTDVFAAGVVLYEALTKKRPFYGSDEADTLLAILIAEPGLPSTLASGIPSELDAVVFKAIEREREERFDSAVAFQEALEKALAPAPPREVAAWMERIAADELGSRREGIKKVLEGRGDAGATVRPGSPARVKENAAAAGESGPSEEPIKTIPGVPRRRSALPAVLIGIAVIAIIGIAFAFNRSHESTSPIEAARETATAPATAHSNAAPEVVPAVTATPSVAPAPDSAESEASASPSVAVRPPPTNHGFPRPKASSGLQKNPYGVTP